MNTKRIIVIAILAILLCAGAAERMGSGGVTTKSQQFLFQGYTFQQERSFKTIREQIRTRRTNPTTCEICGAGGLIWRVETRTYRCRKCRHIQPVMPRV